MARKLTYEEVKHFIEVESGSGCKLLSEEYIRSNEKLKIKCKCSEIFITDFSTFKSKSKHCCKTCTKKKMSKRFSKTHENFIIQVQNKYRNEYTVLGEYTKAKYKLEVKHNKCGFSWKVNANSFLRGDSKCPNCAGRNRDTQSFKKEIKRLIGDEYMLLSEFTGVEKHVEIKHTLCNNIYKVTPASIIHQKSKCPYCSKTKKKTQEEFLQQFYNLVGNEYVVLNEYKNNKTNLMVKHNTCGHVYTVKPYNFLSGRRCPNCAKNKQIDTQEFKNKVFKKVGKEYEVLSEYKNISTKIKFKHTICGKTFNMLPNNFLLNNQRCPNCKRSKGEELLENALCNHNVKYIKEFKFENLIGKRRRLPFDFLLLNKEINILIEYDGEQHFKVIDYWGGKNQFLKVNNSDKIKNQYCIDNNIPLIRIPYWEFDNIEYILENILIHFNLVDTQLNTYDKEIVLKYLVDKNWDHDKYINSNIKHK